MTRTTTLNNAVTEEQVRRRSTLQEFRLLFDIYIKYLPQVETHNLRIRVQETIQTLKQLVSQFTASSKDSRDASFPFKTNKNSEILECANDFIDKHGLVTSWEQLMQIYPISPETKTWLKGQKNDYKGTSILNCIQAALYITVTELNATHEIKNTKIYDVTTSPLVQTTSLPQDSITQPLYLNLTQSLFFYKDTLSPNQGELMFFNLGYSFGGSRADSRYHNKELRTEDCSSCVAKWTKSDCAFTTSTMKLLFQNNCQKDNCCDHMKTKLLPKGTSLDNIMPGDIYVFQKGGHMGIVTQTINSTCFESLTYSRMMPTQEGLGYDIECLTKRDFFFFGHVSDTTNEDL